jgi:hypothetical protein
MIKRACCCKCLRPAGEAGIKSHEWQKQSLNARKIDAKKKKIVTTDTLHFACMDAWSLVTVHVLYTCKNRLIYCPAVAPALPRICIPIPYMG